MSNGELDYLLSGAVGMLKALAQYDVKNIFSSMKLSRISEGKWRISVNQDISSDKDYTNEEWTSSSLNELEVPIDGWFDKTVEFLVGYIASKINGTVKRS